MRLDKCSYVPNVPTFAYEFPYSLFTPIYTLIIYIIYIYRIYIEQLEQVIERGSLQGVADVPT